MLLVLGDFNWVLLVCFEILTPDSLCKYLIELYIVFDICFVIFKGILL